MTYTGIDTAAPLTSAQAKKLSENGVSFVGRYLAPAGYGKAITAEESRILRDAGLAILLCWEIDAAAMGRGAPQGAADAAGAKQCAEDLGVPDGTAIYFACDYNIPDRELPAAEEYIKAAQAVLGAKYHAGAYGPLKLVEFLHERGVCRYLWQCVAWSARFSEAAQTWQYQWQGSPDALAMAEKIGVAVDLDTCDNMRRAGFWMADYKEYADGDGVILEPAKPAEKPAMWYDAAMKWAKDAGLIKDGRPNDPVTRAELATVLYRIYGPSDSRERSGLLEEE